MTDINARIARGRYLLDQIYQDIDLAISYQAIWERCADKADILDRMRHTTEGTAFDRIRDTVHMSLIQTLMRIHDSDTRSASLPNLLAIIERQDCVAHLKTMTWAKSIDIDAKLWAVKNVQAAPRYDEFHTGLKALRNKVITHRDFDQSLPDAEPTGAKYGHEREFLDDTIEILEHLDLVLSGRSNDFAMSQKAYAECADAFWSHCARPAKRRIANDWI